jgi:hypothetical protein
MSSLRLMKMEIDLLPVLLELILFGSTSFGICQETLLLSSCGNSFFKKQPKEDLD